MKIFLIGESHGHEPSSIRFIIERLRTMGIMAGVEGVVYPARCDAIITPGIFEYNATYNFPYYEEIKGNEIGIDHFTTLLFVRIVQAYCNLRDELPSLFENTIRSISDDERNKQIRKKAITYLRPLFLMVDEQYPIISRLTREYENDIDTIKQKIETIFDVIRPREFITYGELIISEAFFSALRSICGLNSFQCSQKKIDLIIKNLVDYPNFSLQEKQAFRSNMAASRNKYMANNIIKIMEMPGNTTNNVFIVGKNHIKPICDSITCLCKSAYEIKFFDGHTEFLRYFFKKELKKYEFNQEFLELERNIFKDKLESEKKYSFYDGVFFQYNNSVECYKRMHSSQPKPKHNDANDDISLESINSGDRTPRQKKQDGKNIKKMYLKIVPQKKATITHSK
jgi:hypothetical protein